MIVRPFLRFETGCASYLFGCAGHGRCAVVDPFEEEVDAYLSFAENKKMKITHVL
jgi:hydroxyacylglutathione hydrolase